MAMKLMKKAVPQTYGRNFFTKFNFVFLAALPNKRFLHFSIFSSEYVITGLQDSRTDSHGQITRLQW
jgi:hypothetical protein